VHAIRRCRSGGAGHRDRRSHGNRTAAQGDQAETFEEFQVAVEAMGGLLRAARPTAVNLAGRSARCGMRSGGPGGY